MTKRLLSVVLLVFAMFTFTGGFSAGASTVPGGGSPCDVFMDHVGHVNATTIHATFHIVCHDSPSARSLYVAGYIARYPGSPSKEKGAVCTWETYSNECQVTVTMSDIAGTQHYVMGYDPESTWVAAADGAPSYYCPDLACVNENYYL